MLYSNAALLMLGSSKCRSTTSLSTSLWVAEDEFADDEAVFDSRWLLCLLSVAAAEAAARSSAYPPQSMARKKPDWMRTSRCR